MLFNNKTRSATGFQSGDAWLPKLFVRAGESFEVEVEFNWEREGVTKDWSITAWGEDGPVTVEHNDGISTDTLPYQKKSSFSTARKTTTPVKAAPVKAAPVQVAPAQPEAEPELPSFEMPSLESFTSAPKYESKSWEAPSYSFDLPKFNLDMPTIERPSFNLPTIPDFSAMLGNAAAAQAEDEVEVFDLDMIDGSSPIDIPETEEEGFDLYSGSATTAA
jgi:hypothetical protein